MQWTFIQRLPSGHRLFSTPDDSRLAIADQSGRTPETTDDGILWLDPTRTITLGDLSFSWLLPLLDNCGAKVATVVDSETAAKLSAEHNMTLTAQGCTARAVRHIGRGRSVVADATGGTFRRTTDLLLGVRDPRRAPVLAGYLCQLL